MDNKISSNQGKKKALIIAISNYDNLPQEKQLPFCKNGGEEIYQILQKQGYEIPDDWKLIGRVTSDQLKKAIFDFFRKRADSKDTLLFYFSGHGIPDGHGRHYLAPTDIEIDLPDYYGFRFSELEDQANKSPAKKIITILDCCFSGAAGITLGSEEDIAKSARSAMERSFKEGDGKCILASSSSSADQISYKMRGGEPYSLFTYCLLEGLKGGKEGEAVNLEGNVTPYTLGNYVYHRIMEEDKRQRPITKTVTADNIILAHYPELVKIQENDAFAWFSRGLALHQLARYEEAIKCYDKAIELDPNNAEAWNSKGLLLSELGKYEEAIKCYDKAIEIKPNFANAWYEKGVAFGRLHKYEEAIKCYDKSLEIDPNNAEAWFGKGLILFIVERYEEAIKCYLKAIELDPNNANVWYYMGSALDNRGKNKDAKKFYKMAKELGYRG